MLPNFLRRMTPADRVSQGIALIRAWIGFSFLMAGLNKLLMPNFEATLRAQLTEWVASNPFAWYAGLMKTVFIPNVHVFAALVPVGEVLTGVGLLLGALTPLCALSGFVMVMNYYLAMQHTGTPARNLNLTFAAVLVGLWWAQAGQYYGLDRWLFRDRGYGS